MAAAVCVVGVVPAGAADRAPTVDVRTVVQAEPAGVVVAASAGDGVLAWIVRPAALAPSPPTTGTLWTVRDGSAVAVAEVPAAGVDDDGLALDVGADRAGRPVAAVVAGAGMRSEVRVVDLRSGTVKALSSTRRGLPVAGAAIDRGTWLFSVRPDRPGPKRTSSLWRAAVRGTAIGAARRIRVSQRGESWGTVVADGRRVAVRAVATAPGAPSSIFGRETWAFGTPLGRWGRAGETSPSDGGYRPVRALGFTSSGRELVTAQTGEDGHLVATRSRTVEGTGSRVRLQAVMGSNPAAVAWDSRASVLSFEGPFETGTRAFGHTAPVTFR